MRTKTTVLVVGALCLLVAPAALAQGKPSDPGKPDNQGTQNAATHTGANQPGPNASLPAKAKAYGHYCQNQSKTHVAGQKGTPFSQCVTAMAKLAHGNTDSPAAACANLSKKHVAGETGTAFSRCKVAAAKLLKDQHSS